jgi:superfamily II DNA or RNA helicase
MKLIRNIADDRVIDLVRNHNSTQRLDAASAELSVFGLGVLMETLAADTKIRLLASSSSDGLLSLWGDESERAQRNQLTAKWLSRQVHAWLTENADVTVSRTRLPQSLMLLNGEKSSQAIWGNCPLTAEGLGLTPGNRLGLIQCTETDEESATFAEWFKEVWNGVSSDAKTELFAHLKCLGQEVSPSLLYHLILFRLFKDRGEELDEERIVKSATGIKNSVVWNKLYKFQRDGVVGAIDKLERYGGAIIADSVGLGKTFQALAVMKYYELRNDRVLVLCPKRLRDNWTLYSSNDLRNSLARDRFNYDVLNHTDLSREGGMSGDIDLSYVNWGNYDLVVIDESHNFRNKAAHRDRVSRYERLMAQIIKAGVKTRVLMLSATPVNNRLSDLKNQIAFITEGSDEALESEGIPSINSTLQLAQRQFSRWLKLDEDERTPQALLDSLGFDYFKLLDLLTIARSRKHVIRYYGTEETGAFPERMPPINRKPEVDRSGRFPSIHEINDEIRRLHLAAYAPLRYILPSKQKEYDEHYSQRLKGSGQRFFRQVDREESLVALMRVNLLKRMESSVVSFALTVERQLADVDRLLAKIDGHEESIEELSIEDVDPDDPTFESLLVGRKVKVLLQDLDKIRWRQDLLEDRNRLATLLSASKAVTPERDAKLAELRALVEEKVREPLNPGNRKILLFTAFSDTAEYLYRELAPWAKQVLGLESALVTGSGPIQSTLRGVRSDLGSALSAFSPRSKERAEAFADEGEIDLLFATDCISEGQNLQDCDTLINYDIHWNPVRIIQRFGRIDRLGSTNERIQLINFWPNIELEEYINLEQRVSGKMVLLDISATGEENIIEHQSGNQMNDLEYRRKQLLRLQDAVIDLEDLSSGVSIADLTLNDFRVDLAGVLRERGALLESLPYGLGAVTTHYEEGGNGIPPGVIFCLRAMGEDAARPLESGYPLAPNYLVHLGTDGAVLLGYPQAKQILDRLRRLCVGKDLPDARAVERLDRETREGTRMEAYQSLLATAMRSILGKHEERAVESLFEPGGTRLLTASLPEGREFEVVGWLVILPAAES